MGTGWWALVAATAWAEERPPFPALTFLADEVGTLLPVRLGDAHQNQPIALDGLVVAGGNGLHPVWDLSDLAAPRLVSTLTSPHLDGEAESHQLAARVGRGTLLATISGLGVDLWDLTDPAAPVLRAAVELEGVRYGDNTEAVWGVGFRGDTLYVGGTSSGLHVLDVSDPGAPTLVQRLPTAALGGISAGPLWVMGDRLVVGTPKESAGLALLDVSDPWAPSLLDHVVLPEKSYIAGVYGATAWLLTPLRPFDLRGGGLAALAATPTDPSEYLSFDGGHLFLGRLRPHPGVAKYDVTDPGSPRWVGEVAGRTDGIDRGAFTDDQFSLPIGNLVVLCDDELGEGCGVGVHDTRPDTTPPELLWVTPEDGAVGVAPRGAIGVSVSDQVDTRSLAAALVLRPLDGVADVSGTWSVSQTVLTFVPDAPLAPDTTFELVLPAGGLRDLMGNGLAEGWRSVFSTGDEVRSVGCAIAPTRPAVVGEDVVLRPVTVEADAVYTWELGDGGAAAGAAPTVRWAAPGRWTVGLTAERDGVRRRCAATQVVHQAATTPAPTRSSTVAVAGGRVWVVHPDHDTVASVHAERRAVVVELPVGDHPRSVAVAGDGSVWVTGQGDDTVTVISDDRVEATIALRWGCAPFGAAASPDGGSVWVTCEGSHALVELDVATRSEVGRVDLPAAPRGLAVAPSGEVVVSRFLSGAGQGELWVVRGGAVEATVPLAYDPGPDDHFGGRGVPNKLSFLALSPDGRRLAVPSGKDNTARGAARDGEPLDADNTVRTIVSFVDWLAGTEDLAARLDLDDHDSAVAAAWSPAGDLLFVASQGTNRVDVFDGYDGARVAGVAVGLAPQGLALDDAGRLWVQDLLGRTLTVLDVGALLAGRDAAIGRLGELRTAAEEPLSEEALLGKQLFYNANRREMSTDGYLSCATCHPDGGHDGQVWDFTDRGEGLRNTIDLRGKAGVGHGPVHWTANFDEIQDFEHDIRSAFGGSGLMDDADFADGRDAPLGAPKAGVSPRLDALAAFVATFTTFPRSPHRSEDGGWTDQARRGARVFERRGCGSCHAGPALTDSAGGVRHDVGTAKPDSGGRLGGPLDGFDTPTLHGLHATAPYLHDGSAATLADALRGEAHVGRLTPREQEALMVFLASLDGEVPDPAGCGCDAGAGGSAGVGGLAAWFVLRRRRPRSGARGASA